MKLSKSSVAFEHPAQGGDHCAECRHFDAPNACKIVAGLVLPEDWCERYSRMKLVPPSEGHKPKGAHGRAAVHAIGRTKTTGNFKRIEKAKGKGAAIAAYQNKLKAHKKFKI